MRLQFAGPAEWSSALSLEETRAGACANLCAPLAWLLSEFSPQEPQESGAESSDGTSAGISEVVWEREAGSGKHVEQLRVGLGEVVLHESNPNFTWSAEGSSRLFSENESDQNAN